jgi:hypothetical protein
MPSATQARPKRVVAVPGGDLPIQRGVGPRHDDERAVDRVELLDFIESNTLSTGTVYKVPPA